MENIQNIVDRARSTTNPEERLYFSKHPSSLVRKALTTNPNISSEILDILSRDCTVNVSYFANKQSFKRTDFRSEDLKNRCVICSDVLNDITKCERC